MILRHALIDNIRLTILLGIVVTMTILTACTNTTAILAEKEALIETLDLEIQSCQNELSKTQTQCSAQLSKIEAEDKRLIAREKQLREQLAEDIELKNVEIEKLQGRLTVKVLDKILFRSGSIVILNEGQEVLTRVAASLENSDENLRVEGHTDNVPIGAVLVKRIPTNWELSVLRASSVVRFLEANGITSERMHATGHSEFKPVTDNTTEENRQLNRRVEIVLVPNVDS